MEGRREVMELIEGRLFDGEWYERTDLLHGSFGGRSGYCVVVWTSEGAGLERGSAPTLIGPFPSAALAYRTVSEMS